MKDSDGGDWQFDLQPVRRAGSGRALRGATDIQSEMSTISADIVAALTDLRRSVDRMSLRIAAIEHSLAIDSPDLASDGGSSAFQRRLSQRAKARRATRVDEDVVEEPTAGD